MKKLREWYLSFLIYLYFKIEDMIKRNIDKLSSKESHKKNESEGEMSLFEFAFCNIEKIKTEDELKKENILIKGY